MEAPEQQPIYLVVFEGDHSSYHWTGGIMIWNIIKSIPCDFRDYQAIWDREVAPLYNQQNARQIQTMFVHREIPSPITEKAHETTTPSPAE